LRTISITDCPLVPFGLQLFIPYHRKITLSYADLVPRVFILYRHFCSACALLLSAILPRFTLTSVFLTWLILIRIIHNTSAPSPFLQVLAPFSVLILPFLRHHPGFNQLTVPAFFQSAVHSGFGYGPPLYRDHSHRLPLLASPSRGTLRLRRTSWFPARARGTTAYLCVRALWYRRLCCADEPPTGMHSRGFTAWQ